MAGEFFIRKPKDLGRKAVIFNTSASLLNAAASVFLLLFVTRICGEATAGVFAIGFSTAQLMLPIGQFGMRNFQASDVIGKYSQHDYVASRIVSSAGMMIIAAAIVLANGYYLEKALILIIMCLLKVTDSFDDVYGGYYQLNNRLDISGKLQLIRIAAYCIVFIGVLVGTKNVLAASVAAVATATVVLIIIVALVRKLFPIVSPKFHGRKLKKLLIECAPLCAGAFLVIYMGNAPKYAIDAYMASEYQAIYNYLFMPCYVIGLFVTFVLQPLLLRMAQKWKDKSYADFKRICIKIFGAALLISALVIVLGYFVGLPLLGWLYGVDVSGYKLSFTILLFGGACYALAIIAQTILTVMRHQFVLLIGFVISGVLVTILAYSWVPIYGITGAATAYLISAGVLLVSLMICFMINYRRDTKRGRRELRQSTD